ncbi:MAG: YcgR family protein [Proteobacteria bacterium]|nr:YcgR family protein [Pseudomonadota bacterium]
MAESEAPTGSDPLPPVFELEQTDDYSRFLLHSKSEILALLRALIQKRSMITVHFDHGRSFLLTTIIALSDDNREFILDIGSNEDMNRRALLADKLILTTIADKVKVQFSLNKLSPTQSGGGPAFLAKIPEQLLRLQRREFFRLSTPVANPLKLCATLTGADASVQQLELPLMDLSGGGVGLVARPDQAELFKRGDTLKDCQIMLPDEGLLVATICVRNIFEVTTRIDSHFFRLGCEFIGLSPARSTLVQRYITRVERERKARLNGLS